MCPADAPADIAVSSIGSHRLPIVIHPAGDNDDLAGLAAGNRAWMESLLCDHGAILFRDFAVADASCLEQFAATFSQDFPDFIEESSPRQQVQGVVHTSTDYPPEYPIQFHNEYSYSRAWPLRIYFCCLTPPTEGGQTPVADSRRVLGRLDPKTRARFQDRGVMYRRNYVTGIGVGWQTSFRTADRAAVEHRCRELGIEWEWLPGNGLRTVQVTDAVSRHPVTGELTWFNHGFFFNVRALEPVELREFMLSEPEDALPTNTYYGDGSPIEAETIEELREAYREEAVEFDWRRGDVLLVDNMLTAHARRPYSGERRIVAVMADGCSRRDVS